MLRYFPVRGRLSGKITIPFAFAITILIVATSADHASAQVLKDRLGISEQAESRPRRANDQVEGTIWEYKSTKYKSQLKKGETALQVSGRFRIEGSAVFATEQTLELPSRSDCSAVFPPMSAALQSPRQ